MVKNTRHRELLNIARNGRAIRSANPTRSGLWDEMLIACGELLITLGKKLKERQFMRNEAVEYYIDPCTEGS